MERTYIAIDLKSFYASVECSDRGLDPLNTNLVVADVSRSEKTICLAASPSLKSYGIPGRARLFEVIQRVKEVNITRQYKNGNRPFTKESYIDSELKKHPEYKLSYIAATPRMARYMEVSSQIVDIYLKYIAPEDMHVYSVDEVFMDVTDYLKTYEMTAHDLAMKMIHEVLSVTGITATAGIGTNLYLCKVAMDIEAKHMKADKDGVRIAELNEKSYREKLWDHTPLTDFWRIGHGLSKRLLSCNLNTMGDIARCSLGRENDFYNEDLLFKLFGINAELIIDHAWGYEPCTIKEIKEYKPENSSLSQGQVLPHPYSAEQGKIIVREMTDYLILDMVDRKLVTDQMFLYVGYENSDKPVRAGINLPGYTSSSKTVLEYMMKLYEREVDPSLEVRRFSVAANHVIPENEALNREEYEQLSLFTDYEELTRQKKDEEKDRKKERSIQEAMISIRKKYGNNAVLMGTSLQEGSTAKERNGQIGGHKA